MLWCPRPGATRAAFASSRQIRGAVSRNRAKRRLREAYRKLETRPGRLDLVFVARPSTLVAQAGEIAREMEQALAAVSRP
jgi:ribonuclease P protein component